MTHTRSFDGYIRTTYHALLSLNLAFTFFFGLVTHYVALAFTPLQITKGPGNEYAFVYYFFRSAVKINDLLHLHASNGVYGHLPNPGSQTGVELAVAIPIVAIAALILLFMRLLSNIRVLAHLGILISSFLCLCALPLVYVCIFDKAVQPYSMSFGWSMATATEIACVFGVIAFYCWRPFSIWALGFLLVMHYGFWLPLLQKIRYLVPFYDVILIPVFLIAYVLSGALAMLYLSRPSRSAAMPRNVSAHFIWLLSFSAVAVLIAAILWLPGRGYALTRTKDLQSLTIRMRRTGCSGRCPIYNVTIQGNGTVDYVGQQYVRDKGPRQIVINKDQLHDLLVAFDRSDFFDLEDRAFSWSFHSPRVDVEITVDGKTKRVTGDTYQVESKSAPQARFVEAAAAVDKAVGTDQWVK